MIDDIEKHCHSKRLKKNIYKLDCIRMGINGSKITNPAVSAGASEPLKLVTNVADPVIDY